MDRNETNTDKIQTIQSGKGISKKHFSVQDPRIHHLSMFFKGSLDQAVIHILYNLLIWLNKSYYYLLL